MTDIIVFHGIGGLSNMVRSVLAEAALVLRSFGHQVTISLIQLPVTDEENKPVVMLDGLIFTVEDYSDVEIAVDLLVKTALWEQRETTPTWSLGQTMVPAAVGNAYAEVDAV